jgi:hypothetical protein
MVFDGICVQKISTCSICHVLCLPGATQLPGFLPRRDMAHRLLPSKLTLFAQAPGKSSRAPYGGNIERPASGFTAGRWQQRLSAVSSLSDDDGIVADLIKGCVSMHENSLSQHHASHIVIPIITFVHVDSHHGSKGSAQYPLTTSPERRKAACAHSSLY